MAGPPLTADEFAGLMDGLEPFESRPRIAVAVSGGADSMALCLLADRWARERGGAAVALTVDHGLRPESASEARQVGQWLAPRGIGHHVLSWAGPKPAADLQAAARQARYRLLCDWCRARGVLHLLLAHHRDDQAETFLLRLARGSGVDGLSAMAAVVELPEARLLRPLLGTAPDRLRATLREAGQPWIEDPSNASAAFGRVRIRRLLPALAAEGLAGERLAATARRLGRARGALEQAAAGQAARGVFLHPAGFAWCDGPAVLDCPAEVSLRLLSRLALVIGGRAYPPRLERLERLRERLGAGAGGTLAGCLFAWRRGRLLVCREPAAVASAAPVGRDREAVWDGRFRFSFARSGGSARIEALGADGWRAIVARVPRAASAAVPPLARRTLPAIRDAHGISAVPHLGYKREEPEAAVEVLGIRTVAAMPLTAVRHCLV